MTSTANVVDALLDDVDELLEADVGVPLVVDVVDAVIVVNDPVVVVAEDVVDCVEGRVVMEIRGLAGSPSRDGLIMRRDRICRR